MQELQYFGEARPCFDGRFNIYSAVPLPEKSLEPVSNHSDFRQGSFVSQCLYVFQIVVNIPREHDARQGDAQNLRERSFKVKVRFMRVFSKPDLISPFRPSRTRSVFRRTTI